MSDTSPETIENYRKNAIEALRMMLDIPEAWPPGATTKAAALIRLLDTDAPTIPENRPYRPIIAIDVDGPLHAYIAWKGAGVLDGGPVSGAMQAIHDYTAAGYEVHIVSSRLHQKEGLEATRRAISRWLAEVFGEDRAAQILRNVEFTINKPPASITIDDRVWLFLGVWPTVAQIRAFKPWRSYDEPAKDPEPAEKDMNRSLLTLIMGMIVALASTGMRSDLAPEARRAVEEIHAILLANNEEHFASIFEIIKKCE